MKTPNKAPVVVAGGGIGGLAAALALAIKGFRVTVLEQASRFAEIGAGIQLAPNAWAVLDALQVGALAKRDAVFIEKLLLMDGISGDAVINIPLDGQFRTRYGNPYAVTHRADIHAFLLEGCRARSALIELRTNSRVSGYTIETRACGWKSRAASRSRRSPWHPQGSQGLSPLDAALSRAGRDLD
jgi:salicylate hydroxylase